MTITSAPRSCLALFHWIIFFFLSFPSGLQAQTTFFTEDFESWNGSLNCLSGWNCGTTANCTSGLACNWGRNDIFGPAAQPSVSDCDGSGFYARCHSSQMILGDVPSLASPAINLSGVPATDPVVLSFCFINKSVNLIDSDGFQVSFSNDGGATWQAYLLDFNVYNTWTNLVVPVPGTFRAANFRFRFDGVGNMASVDMGIDDVELTNNAVVCHASASVISVFGPSQICRDSIADVLLFSQTGSQSPDYAYIITDTIGIISTVLADNDFDFNELAAGIYEVSGVSYDGLLNADPGMFLDSVSATVCQVFSSNTLTISVQELSASISVVSNYNGFPISRYGARDGAVTAMISGGSGLYAYVWDTEPPQTSGTAIGLEAGTYNVVATDLSGCEVSATVSLSQPDSLNVLITPVTNFHGAVISCLGASDGALEAVVNGGVGAYTYQWAHKPGETAKVTSGLGAGTYTVTVTDANGATKSASVEITAPSELQIASVVTPVICANQSDGGIAIHATGGTAPYTYQWDHGPSLPVLEGLSPNTYRCRISDANGCTVYKQFTLEDRLPMQIEAIVVDNVCYDGDEGYISVNVNGGTGPYIFFWSNNAEGQEIFNLKAGDYSVTVADSKGCSESKIFTVGEPSPLLVDITTKADNGRGIGTATAVVSGGITPYEYSWITGDTSESVNGLKVGAYMLTVTDANGCEIVSNFEIEPNDRPECLEIHMGFSPNGDGINETWFIPCIEFFPQNKITVLNRWGQELYAAEGYDNSWGGTAQGQPLPDGTYFYVIEIQTNNNRRQFKGTVNIIR